MTIFEHLSEKELQFFWIQKFDKNEIDSEDSLINSSRSNTVILVYFHLSKFQAEKKLLINLTNSIEFKNKHQNGLNIIPGPK